MLHTTSVLFTSHRFNTRYGRAAWERKRVVFCGLPAYGHLYPLLPLAAAARAAGHDVLFVTGEEFVPVMEAQGFSAQAAGVGPLEVAAEIFSGPVPRLADGGPNRDAQAELFLDALPRRNAAALSPVFHAVRPDLIVYEQTAVGAAIAAAATGIPAVSHGIVAGAATDTFDLSRSHRHPSLLAEFGLASLDDLRPDRFLDPFPRSLRTGPMSRITPTPIQPGAWRHRGGATPRWLAECRRPVVFLTLGTVFGSAPKLREVMEALAELNVEVLAALGPVDAQEIGTVPGSVHIERFVDQARILPLVDAVVHHGGSGTTLGAASQGLPQLILPTGADQKPNGEAVAAAGAGLMITPDVCDRVGIAQAVGSLLGEPQYAAAAQAIRREIAAMPSPDALVASLVAPLLAA